MKRAFKVDFNTHKSLAADEKMLYICAVSIFLPFWITIGCFFSTFIYILSGRERLKAAFDMPHHKMLLLFFLSAAVGPALSGWAAGLGVNAAICVMLTVMLWAKSMMTLKIIRSIERIICAMSAAAFAVALWQSLFGRGDPSFRAAAFFTNPNHYAAAIEIVVILCIWRLLKRRGALPLAFTGTAWVYIVILCNLAGLYLCGCRTAWIAIAAAAVVLLILQRRGKILLILGAIGVVLAIVALEAPQIFPRLRFLQEAEDIRRGIWDTAWQGFLQNPVFGYGALGYQKLSRLTAGAFVAMHSHNLYLDTLLSFGIIGTALLGIYAVHELGRVIGFHIKGDKSGICAPVLSCAAAVLVHGMLDVTLLGVQTGGLFILVMAFAGILGGEGDTREREAGQ